MEQNVRSSSLYRLYNDDVPVFLRNRPRRLIDDWRKKMRAVQPHEIDGVRVRDPSSGVFLVPARGAGRPDHEVVLLSRRISQPILHNQEILVFLKLHSLPLS